MSLYTLPDSSVLTHLLKHSPLKVHREVYRVSLLQRGGFYPNAYIPPEVIEIILTGKAVTLLPDDSMAPYNDKLVLAKEKVAAVPVGYFFKRRLPMHDELTKGIRALMDTGVVAQVYIMVKKR